LFYATLTYNYCFTFYVLFNEKAMTEKMMNVFKVAVIVLFVVALGMGSWLIYTRFFGGGDDGGDGSVEEKITLSWWILWEDAEDVQVLADAYEAKNPSVKIEIEEQKVDDLYFAKIEERLGDNSVGTGADILRIHSSWIPLLQQYLSPLPASVMSKTDYDSVFYPTYSTDLTGSDGQIYAIPLMFDGLGLYYNKDLLREAGYTVPEDNWDHLVTQAKALTRYGTDGRIEIAGLSGGAESNVQFYFETLSLLMLQEQASIVDQSGVVTFGKDGADNEKVANAIKFYTDLTTRYNVWDRDLDPDVQMFAEGRLAMMFAPSWRVHDIHTALETYGATLDFDIAPVPQQPGYGDDSINWSDYWAEAVSAESPHSDIAWDFLTFITEQEQLQTFYEKCQEAESRDFGEIYPRKDMANTIISDQYVGAYVKMAETSRSWRMVEKVSVAGEFGKLIEELTLSGGPATSESIQTKLETTAVAVNQILSQ
jgi:ABC-type glycerol-3-phosphate transport system substrate-binding protein